MNFYFSFFIQETTININFKYLLFEGTEIYNKGIILCAIDQVAAHGALSEFIWSVFVWLNDIEFGINTVNENGSEFRSG